MKEIENGNYWRTSKEEYFRHLILLYFGPTEVCKDTLDSHRNQIQKLSMSTPTT